MQALRDAKRAWDAGEDTRFWGRLGENLSDTGRWNYRRIRGTHEIVTRENMESYIPTLSPEKAERTLNEIRATQQGVAARTTTWGDYFNGLDDGQKEYIPKLIEETDNLANLTGNDLVQANRDAQKAVLDHNQAVRQHSLSVKAGRLATQAFSMALNMAAFAAISFGIQLVATGIENFVHRVERSNEAMRQASSDYESPQHPGTKRRSQISITRYLHGSKAVPVFYAVRISNRSDSLISCSRNRLIFTIHGSDQPFPNVLLGNC